MIVLVPVQVYRLTGSTLAVGLLALTQFVPLVVLTIVGGALADTHDRRGILLRSNAGIAVVMGAFVAVSIPHHMSVAVVFVLGFLAWSSFSLGSGAGRLADAAARPARPAAGRRSAQRRHLQPGGSGRAGARRSADRLDRPRPDLRRRAGRDARRHGGRPRRAARAAEEGALRLSVGAIVDGFRYLVTQHVVLGFFLIDTLAMIFGMPNALFPALAQHVFSNPASVGYLFAAPAAGAFMISLFSGWAARVRRQGVAIVIAASGWGLAIGAFGLTRSLPVGLALLALAGAADQVSAIFRSTIVLTVTPDHMRGRLGGIEFAQVAGTPSLGNLEAGVVASLTSLRFSIVSGGIGCVLGTLAVAACFPVLLRYDAARPRAAA